MLYVYGDDGADEKSERVVSVAVVGGCEETWAELEPQWIGRCNGIPFHATDCESGHGDYEGIPHETNHAMYRDLVTLLVNSGVSGVGIAIDLVAQRKIFPASPNISHYRAFAETLVWVADLAENAGKVAEIVLDISAENKFNAHLIYSGIRGSESRYRNWLAPKMSFVRASECARVQAADLLAYESWKVMDHTVGQFKRNRASWAALRATGRFETRGYSEEWFFDLKRYLQSGQAEKIAGFNEAQYRKWLADQNRLNNLTNLFTFISLQNEKL